MTDHRHRPRGDPHSRPLPLPADPSDAELVGDDPTEALDRAQRSVNRVVQYQPRGVSVLSTEVDPARRAGLARVELQAQVGELATGARLHLTVTAHHAHTLRWVVVGTACATTLSLFALAAAAYAVAWLTLGG